MSHILNKIFNTLSFGFFLSILVSCTEKSNSSWSPSTLFGSESSEEEWRKILTSYAGGGTTGLRQEQARFLTLQEAEDFIQVSAEQLRTQGVTGESWQLRDVPAPGRVNGTVSDYLPQTEDGFVVRIRTYTDRDAAGGEHQVARAFRDVSKLEIKIAVPTVDGRRINGVLRKPSILFYNSDLALMLGGVESLIQNRSAIISRTFQLNQAKFEEKLIGAMIDKVQNVLQKTAGGGPLQVVLNIQYERSAYSATFKDGNQPIDVQITRDKVIKYRMPRPIDASRPYGGPIAALQSGVIVGEVPNEHFAVLEFKIPVGYAILYQENKELLGRKNAVLKQMMDRYSKLQNQLGVPLESGKSSYYRNFVRTECPLPPPCTTAPEIAMACRHQSDGVQVVIQSCGLAPMTGRPIAPFCRLPSLIQGWRVLCHNGYVSYTKSCL